MSAAIDPYAPVLRAQHRAGFWRRAVALAMDGLWLFCTLGTLGWLLFGIPWLPAPPDSGAVGIAATAMHHGVPALVLIIGWSRFGATPGKRLLELRVVDARSGARPSLAQAAVRYLGYYLSALPLGLGFVWVAWDPCKQGLHDKLARTEVVVVAEEILPGVAV